MLVKISQKSFVKTVLIGLSSAGMMLTLGAPIQAQKVEVSESDSVVSDMLKPAIEETSSEVTELKEEVESTVTEEMSTPEAEEIPKEDEETTSETMMQNVDEEQTTEIPSDNDYRPVSDDVSDDMNTPEVTQEEKLQ